MLTSFPFITMEPFSFLSAPNSKRATSVRPAPINPEKPRISPLWSLKLTSLTAVPAQRFFTSSTTGASSATVDAALGSS